MRNYLYILLRLAQLLVLVNLASYLVSKLEQACKGYVQMPGSLSASRQKDISGDKDIDSVDVQTITPFIPLEPNEIPIQKPADIPTEFPIEEADYCLKRPNLDIIAYVHSALRYTNDRDMTRRTWANASAYGLGVNIGVVFMVGRPIDDFEKAILMEESKKYHDIVQGNYGDDYRLLSYKSLASIYWINKHCSLVPWTLHIDDDANLDIFLFFKLIKELPPDIQEKLICEVNGGPVLRAGRWSVSFEQYPALNYPPYCTGLAWFLQTKFLPSLLKASKVVPFLWVDDAYVTGVLAAEASLKHHEFQDYYGFAKPQLDEIGEKVAWFSLRQNRLYVWDRIVEYYRNLSMHKI